MVQLILYCSIYLFRSYFKCPKKVFWTPIVLMAIVAILLISLLCCYCLSLPIRFWDLLAVWSFTHTLIPLMVFSIIRVAQTQYRRLWSIKSQIWSKIMWIKFHFNSRNILREAILNILGILTDFVHANLKNESNIQSNILCTYVCICYISLLLYFIQVSEFVKGDIYMCEQLLLFNFSCVWPTNIVIFALVRFQHSNLNGKILNKRNEAWNICIYIHTYIRTSLK